MYGEETAERQHPRKKMTQRESNYDKETETRKWESSMKRKKKSLVEDSGPTDLGRVRTSRTWPSLFRMGVDHVFSQIRPSRDSTEQGAGNSTCWCLRQ